VLRAIMDISALPRTSKGALVGESPDQGDCVLTSSGPPPLATRDLIPADRLHNAHHTPLTGPREFDIVRRSPRLRGKHVI
jgi:hypothetical protein